MTSHGIARTSRTRTEEQIAQELEKIKKYRSLEDQIRAEACHLLTVAGNNFTPDLLPLTSKLLKLNPEYNTIWNVRRRLLISGLLSKSSDGLQPSTASQSTSRTATTTASSGASSSSSSSATRPDPGSPTTGMNGTTADTAVGTDKVGIHDHDAAKASNGDIITPEEKDMEVLHSELAFTIPLLIEAPKCYWIWNYRLWILQKAIERLHVSTARRIWEEELGLVSKMLTRDRRNFHAWGYRRHVVAQLESPKLDGASLVEPEFAYTTKMIENDLSNFSAWHNRSNLIPRLLDERGANAEARRSFLDSELSLIHGALDVGPEDQSLWHYHRFLMLGLTDFVGHATITPNFSREDRVTYVTGEIELVKELLEDYDNIKAIYEALLEYTFSLASLEERELEAEESGDIREWLSKLRTLDPMREGLWNDLERALK